ncbi:DUF2281 domain-containing protein [Persicitalea sp.]|uniref:DUF2281 domain-containing protein n=1 Tax=Persicitalea sp. TaxID=3100273 RepID=UPI0035941928
MEKLELKNELNRMVERMPASLVQEILDFAEFLLTKKSLRAMESNIGMRSSSNEQTAHLEEEFLNYKTLYPKLENE